MKFGRLFSVVIAGAILAAMAGAVLVVHGVYTHAPHDLESLAPRAPRVGSGATAGTAAASHPLAPARRSPDPRPSQ
jgi:hypothetical protein